MPENTPRGVIMQRGIAAGLVVGIAAFASAVDTRTMTVPVGGVRVVLVK